MKSMTGYGSAEVMDDAFQLSVEVKSYNSRFLEINHTIPYVFSPFEMEIDEKIGEVASRGHVEIGIRFHSPSDDLQIVVDPEAVARYSDAFARIAALSGKALKPQLSDYLAADGVLVSVRESDAERYRKPLFDALSRALVQLEKSKEREGSSTKADLLRLGAIVSDGLKVVEAHAGELENLVKANLTKRFNEMLGDGQYDENRFLQEVAVLLVKYSVNEEIKRLAVHLDRYFALLDLDEPVGKRLDFLCQEMNREINTIGSKSQIVEMNLEVVKMKDGLENIREQIRNIE